MKALGAVLQALGAGLRSPGILLPHSLPLARLPVTQRPVPSAQCPAPFSSFSLGQKHSFSIFQLPVTYRQANRNRKIAFCLKPDDQRQDIWHVMPVEGEF